MRQSKWMPLTILAGALACNWGCEAIDFWRPPTPTENEYQKGLIIFYPGSANLHIEGLGFYYAFRDAGIDLAFEEMMWQDYLEHFFTEDHAQPKINANAVVEAERVSQFIRSHPDSPVTMVTYSGGAVFALRVAANLPDDTPVDRIIITSAGIWKGTDLTPALAHCTLGIVNYWSPRENGPILVSRLLGLADGSFMDPASSFGFDQTDPKLTQIMWTEDMIADGNNGEHLDFLINLPWLMKYIAPWVVTEKPQ